MKDTSCIIKKHPILGIEVSSDGRVRVPRRGWTFGWRYNSRSCCYMGCRVNGRNYRVHRLIAETFLPNPENKPEVDHINRNPSDNRVENLRWATRTENQRNTKKCDRVEKDGHLHTWECGWGLDMHQLRFSDGKYHHVTEREYAILCAFKPCHRFWKGRRG